MIDTDDGASRTNIFITGGARRLAVRATRDGFILFARRLGGPAAWLRYAPPGHLQLRVGWQGNVSPKWVCLTGRMSFLDGDVRTELHSARFEARRARGDDSAPVQQQRQRRPPEKQAAATLRSRTAGSKDESPCRAIHKSKGQKPARRRRYERRATRVLARCGRGGWLVAGEILCSLRREQFTSCHLLLTIVEAFSGG